MSRGSVLTDFEKGQILALQTTGATDKGIAKIVGRHKTIVKRFLARPQRRQKRCSSRETKMDGLGEPSFHPRSFKDRGNHSCLERPFEIGHFCQTDTRNTARNVLP